MRYEVGPRENDPNPELVAEALRRLAGLGVVHVTGDENRGEVFVVASPVHRNLAVVNHVLDRLPQDPPVPAAEPAPAPDPPGPLSLSRLPKLPLSGQ
ncbi:hypothetical protein [Nocardia sp. NPDC059228]|uniref:hypothetical protein n=1 Tax=Nocardia sp. NPDC059228 TaxID=3346777 RepID=UPI0036A287A4